MIKEILLFYNLIDIEFESVWLAQRSGSELREKVHSYNQSFILRRKVKYCFFFFTFFFKKKLKSIFPTQALLFLFR